MKKIGATLGAMFLAVVLSSCYPYDTGIQRRTYRTHRPPVKRIYTPRRTPSVRRTTPYFPGSSGSSYGVVRDRNGRVIRRSGAIWGSMPSRTKRGYRVGLPRNATPRNIKRKFQADVRYLRRQRRRR